MKKENNLKVNQSGIASMVIVILIMTLLTLIVVSMTQNSNREQRQALDRQLNSQALYAAESGIADAKDYVAANPTTAVKKKTNCDPTDDAEPGNYFKGKTAQVGGDPVISYSCVLYNLNPEEIVDDNIGVDSPFTIPVEDKDPSSFIHHLKITWEKNSGGDIFSGCHNAGQGAILPSDWPANCEAGMLRVELMDTRPGSRKDFLDRIFLAYLKPTTGASSTTSYANGIGLEKQGLLVNGRCDNDGACEATIRNIGLKKLYLNVRSIYMSNKFKLEGVALRPDGTTKPIEFREAQMSVDSTGRANDVIKRISVAIPLNGREGSLITPFVIQTSDELCKQLQLRRNSVIPVSDVC